MNLKWIREFFLSPDSLTRVMKWLSGTIQRYLNNQETHQQLKEKNLELEAKNQELIQLNERLNRLNILLEEKFKEAQHLANVTKYSHDAIYTRDLKGIITSWNRSAERIFGYKPEEIIGQSVEILIPEDLKSSFKNEFTEANEGNEVVHARTKRLTKSGHLVDVEVSVSPIKDEQGNIVYISVITRDVTEKKKIEMEKAELYQKEREARLWEQKQTGRLSALVKAGLLITSSLNLDQVLDSILRLCTEIMGVKNGSIMLINDQQELTRVATMGIVKELQYSSLKVGESLSGWVASSGEPQTVLDMVSCSLYKFPEFGEKCGLKSYLGAPLKIKDKTIGVLNIYTLEPREFSRDEIDLFSSFANQAAIAIENARLYEALRGHIEQLAMAQAQLVQAEKLASLGQMLSGIAHELNNPLTSVYLYAQLILSDSNLSQKIRSHVQNLQHEVERAIKIIKNLLTFARKRPPQRQNLDLTEVLENTLDLLAYELNVNNIEVVRQLDSQLPQTIGDYNQLQQVFLNLIINAKQAILEARPEGGTIYVTTRLIKQPEEVPSSEELLHPRFPFIQISIRDNGVGISEENLKKIFDPFFTTKEPGKGTGLGLSVCFSLVQQYEGKIYATSQLGKGSTFFVELPVKDFKKEDEVPKELFVSEFQPDVPGKKILIIDDDEAIVEVIERILSKDHEVDQAISSYIALEKLEKSHYDLILMDFKMPGISGQKLYEHIAQRNPELSKHIIFMTGDVVGEETQKFLESLENQVMVKPFNLDELKQAVQKVIKRQTENRK